MNTFLSYLSPAHATFQRKNYGNTGCGVFKRGLQNFCLQITISQRKLLNFENWVNGEVSKIGHHFSKESDLKIDANKKCQ